MGKTIPEMACFWRVQFGYKRLMPSRYACIKLTKRPIFLTASSSILLIENLTLRDHVALN